MATRSEWGMRKHPATIISAMNYSIKKKTGTTRTQQAVQHAQQREHQWRRWRTIRRLRGVSPHAHWASFHKCDDHTHISWLKFWAHFTSIHGHQHGALSLTRPSPLSASSFSSCQSPPSSSTSSCSLCSSWRRTWQTCAAPPRTRVRTLLTSSSRLQYMLWLVTWSPD